MARASKAASGRWAWRPADGEGAGKRLAPQEEPRPHKRVGGARKDGRAARKQTS
ncbi:hypothetical protein GCM10010166_24920 [Couchioplanes caeruleus subsp. azureus]|nr:hypothetical protein GCM10010166_24920 [Couchioplanes caeruleus subsp. azureus]